MNLSVDEILELAETASYMENKFSIDFKSQILEKFAEARLAILTASDVMRLVDQVSLAGTKDKILKMQAQKVSW